MLNDDFTLSDVFSHHQVLYINVLAAAPTFIVLGEEHCCSIITKKFYWLMIIFLCDEIFFFFFFFCPIRDFIDLRSFVRSNIMETEPLALIPSVRKLR